MRIFKKMRVVLLAVVMLFALAFGFACKDNGGTTSTGDYIVTFMVEGVQYGETQSVKKGRRITEPEEPEFSTQGYVFTGWYTDEAFAADKQWNFKTDIVSSDLTLYAGYRVVYDYVTELAKADEACTSKLVWAQATVSDASAYEVKLTDKSGNVTTLAGSVSFDAEAYKVTFTPETIPQGGKYAVSVKDTTKTAEAAVLEDVLFGGAGTENNPYQIGSALDFTMVNQANVEAGTYFSLASNVTIETSREAQKAYTFNGTLLGNGRTITLENSNCAAIYKLGEQGYVYNVGIAGSVSTSSFDSIGAIVDFNAGKVEKINVTANVTSTAGITGSNGLANALNAELEDGKGNRGIAGGVVGTNLATGIVYNCKITTADSSTGTVKANVAGGTIVGLNYGKVEMCVSNGCFGAWNSTESGGKSLSKYSYAGGIVGINAGTVTKCSVTGSAKLLAQRYEDNAAADAAAGTTNSNFGGIAGYNMENATISECYFSGIRVHADENVGGIAGLNAGAISDCYVAGVYNDTTKVLSYVGGRKNVGGVVGKSETTGTVANCYVTANVYAYVAGTAYSVAESASNCVYVSANLNANSLAANPAAVALTAPSGNGNVAVAVEANSYDGQAIDYALSAEYLTTINGNTKFVYDGDLATIVLAFESEVLPELTREVSLYNGSEEWKSVTIAETGAAISGPSKKGYVFVGWSVAPEGEVIFAKGEAISYYGLQDYADGNGNVTLYAQFEERVPNEGLIVAVWGRYVTAELTTSIETEYKTYLGDKLTYTVEFRTYSENAVADFCAAIVDDGDIDVIIGAGNTVNAANGIDYIYRADMITEGLTSRKAALLTDTERAIDFYCYVTGVKNENATVTFVVGGEETKGTVNSFTGETATAPTVTAEDGYEFLGWATKADATEATLTGASFSYADVAELLTDGAVKLYPVFEAKAVEGDTVLKVSVWAKAGAWVTDAELEAIKSGFETYLTSNGYTVANLTITYVVSTATKVADLGAEVNEAGDFDIVIGSGSNITSQGGVAVLEKKSILTDYVAADRQVARLTNNELAVLLYNYLTGATAEA